MRCLDTACPSSNVCSLVKFLIYPPRGERERGRREKERGSTARSLVRGLLVTFVGRASIERNFFRMIIVIKILRVKRRDGGGDGEAATVAYTRRNEQVERENGKASGRTGAAEKGREGGREMHEGWQERSWRIRGPRGTRGWKRGRNGVVRREKLREQSRVP